MIFIAKFAFIKTIDYICTR